MASSSQQNRKDDQLKGFFHRVLSQKELLKGQHGRSFLEALCLQPDPVKTLGKLVADKQGLNILNSALFSQESRQFLNGAAADFLHYLQHPELKAIYGGSFLQGILQHITDPPIFWNALHKCVRSSDLSVRSLEAFVWLLLELVSLPTDKAKPFYEAARDVQEPLAKVLSPSIKTNLQKIKFILDSVSSNRQIDSEALISGHFPGGRHDNDHESIKDISILPTSDELQCVNPPFLRPAAEILQVPPEIRFHAHIDNQFRLLREDMMRDLREDVQIVQTSKSKRHRGKFVDNVTLHGVSCNDKEPWSLEFRCTQDLLPKMPKEDRVEYIRKNSNFFRHDSVCCILADKKQVALGSIVRDENKLAAEPPIIGVRFDGTSVVKTALIHLKRARSVQLVQINTAIFAYAPILKQLQNITWLDLGSEIVDSTVVSPLETHHTIEDILGRLRLDPSMDLQADLKVPQPTRLDLSQVDCFKAGLTQKISIIQGPPGAPNPIRKLS